MHKVVLLLSLSAVFVIPAIAADPPQPTSIALDSAAGLEASNTKIEATTYRGRRSIHLVPPSGQENSDGDMLAAIAGSDFKDGSIELDVAGFPRPGAPDDARGFIGVGFRVQGKGDKGEFIYLRPTNARSDDQLRRNHSTQYVSAPDYPWHRLRKENPGVYESYVDLDAGAWTHMKIVVSGTKAQLYVNGADHPCLVVNDLKLGDSRGMIALWAHPTTEGYFANLQVK